MAQYDPKAQVRDQTGKFKSSVLLVVRNKQKSIPDRQSFPVVDQAKGQKSKKQAVVHAGSDDGWSVNFKAHKTI